MQVPSSEQRAAQPTTTMSTTTTLVPGLSPGTVGLGEATTTTAFVEPFAILAPWPEAGTIDVRFTCDGAERSPTLRWTAPPAGTVELALVVTDDDAADFVHWAVTGIAPSAGEVGEGLKVPDGIEGRNGAGSAGWTAPCPPIPGDTHTYRFAIHALAEPSPFVAAGFSGAEVLAHVRAASSSSAEITATYTRADA